MTSLKFLHPQFTLNSTCLIFSFFFSLLKCQGALLLEVLCGNKGDSNVILFYLMVTWSKWESTDPFGVHQLISLSVLASALLPHLLTQSWAALGTPEGKEFQK